jgi:hypothetical protein
VPHERQRWQHRQQRRSHDVHADHEAFAVDAVDPGADGQAEDQVGEPGRCGRDPQVQGRAAELVDEQRQREAGQRTADERSRLVQKLSWFDQHQKRIPTQEEVTQIVQQLELR